MIRYYRGYFQVKIVIITVPAKVEAVFLLGAVRFRRDLRPKSTVAEPGSIPGASTIFCKGAAPLCWMCIRSVKGLGEVEGLLYVQDGRFAHRA